MAALPSPTQVAGSHYQLYEAFYNQVDPTNSGTIGALEAAKFLKKSGLSDVILRDIWDLSDPNGEGFLTKLGFFVALKLVSLAQAGKEISTANITVDAPPPKMGDVSVMSNSPCPAAPVAAPMVPPMVPPMVAPLVANASDWTIKPVERMKYDKLYDMMQPINGIVPGNKVKQLLIDSRLPTDALGKIWDLADMDKDGSFDKHEFTVAMHLVYKALEKQAVPDVLPPELLPPTIKRDSVSIPGLPPNAVPVLPIIPTDIAKPVQLVQAVQPPVAAIPWVVTPEEKTRFDALFIQSDFDRDGFVSGAEIKDVFLKSGVLQEVLADVWNLCDTGQQGKLNSEQFALAMWLINRKLKGFDPPKVLTPEMVPPSCRAKLQAAELTTTTPYSNPEIEMISKDIEALAKEKLNLETEIATKEAEINIKSGEIKSLQGELDALSATLKQLEHQRGEAQNRLNDLRNQRALVESELADVNLELKAEQAQVDKLRTQAEEQETMLKSQEAELNSKKQELEGLKNEEIRLEQQQNEFKNKIDSINSSLQESQLQISQVKAKVSALEETQRQMKDAIALADSAIASGDASGISESSLSIEPEFRDSSYTKILQETSQKNVFSDNKGAFDKSQTKSDDSFVNNNAFKTDPFASSNPDPFSSSNDPFASQFPNKPSDGFTTDPFNSFGGGAKPNNKTDPFGDTSRAGAKTPADQTDKDAFGCDPFAILHAPTAATLSTHPSAAPPRPESPSPALPPKKSKQPPPRPAPPRPAQGPNIHHSTPAPAATTNDPFAPFNSSNNSSINEFADFSNFNNKFSDTASTLSRLSSTSSSLNRSTLEFTEDPFRDYRYEDPFSIADPFEDTDSSVDVPSKPSHNKIFSNFNDAFGSSFDDVFKNNNINKKLNGLSLDNSPLPSEEEQLAWAAAESLKLEEERKKNSAQAKVDMELALKLSKTTSKKKRFFS